MKEQINEIKRMQELAGVTNEAKPLTADALKTMLDRENYEAFIDSVEGIKGDLIRGGLSPQQVAEFLFASIKDLLTNY